jgi:putative ABC transport system permease protein
MINYIRIAVRHLGNNKVFAFVTIAGLTIAFICWQISMLYISRELSFDRWHRHPEEVYRVVKDFVNPDGARIPDATTPPALAPALKRDLPEVAFATRFFPAWGRKYLIQYGEKRFYESDLVRVDSNFFDVLDFPFIAGTKGTAFKDIHSIVLTERVARKYFGNKDPIGKLLRINVNNGKDYTVTGIVKNVPAVSHFSFDFLIPLEVHSDISSDWGWYNFYTYVRLKPGSDPVSFNAKLQPLFKRYQHESLNRYYAQPLTDIHLKSNLKWELGANNDWHYIKMLVAIALLILVIAAINYINIVTAQAIRRSKEVGVRKAIGASRYSLISQFLTESLLIAVLSFVFAWGATSLLLPLVRSITGYELSVYPTGTTFFWALVAAAPIIGLVAGIYPAVFLSSFQPVKVLKGGFQGSGRDIGLRKYLMVFQFLVSAVLISGSLIISKQLNFIRDKELGFDKENVVVLPNVRGAADPESLVADLNKISEVKSIGRADGVLAGENATNGVSARYPLHHISLNFMRADDGFLPSLGIRLTEGRNFSRQFATDTGAIILNETAVHELGLKPPFIGQRVIWDDDSAHDHSVTVIGIAEDFNFSSLHERIKPFGFIYEKDNGSNFFIKMNSKASLNIALADIESVWKAHNPDKPFTFSFQDEQVARLYLGEHRLQSIFLFLTILAVCIALLGLFGLTTYITQSNAKEIGIRKVLGSTVGQVLWLISSRFVKLVVIALIIATPVAWYVINRWLENFAYKTEIPWWIFAVTGGITLGITLVTVTLQSLKSALTNPTKSLRTE